MKWPGVTPLKPTSRERYALIEEEHQEALEQDRRYLMATRKTKVGDRVERFADVSPLREQNAELRAALIAAYDEAAALRQAHDRMEQSGGPDPARFGVLGGGDR
jgi:hypothetical protein